MRENFQGASLPNCLVALEEALSTINRPLKDALKNLKGSLIAQISISLKSKIPLGLRRQKNSPPFIEPTILGGLGWPHAAP